MSYTLEKIEKSFYRWNGDDHCVFKCKINGLIYATIDYKRDVSNCKLAYIVDIRNLLNSTATTEEKVEILTEIFNNQSQIKAIFLSITTKMHFDFIKKHFKIICANKIPIGYNSSFQYHITLLRPGITEGDCFDRINNTTDINIKL